MFISLIRANLFPMAACARAQTRQRLHSYSYLHFDRPELLFALLVATWVAPPLGVAFASINQSEMLVAYESVILINGDVWYVGN